MLAGMPGGRLIGRDLPLRSLALQRAVLDQRAHDLLDEQRIAAGTLEDPVAQGAGGPRHRSPNSAPSSLRLRPH
jgi:hypothetical protein